MTLAALVAQNMLQTLLDAIQPAAGELTPGSLKPGTTVAAKLTGFDAAGLAIAEIDGVAIKLELAGPQARQAALQPGAALLLRIEAAATPAGPITATLVSVSTPEAKSAGPGARQASSTFAAAARLAPSAGQPRPAEPSAGPPRDVASTPRALAAPLVAPALATQDSLAPLFANLRGVATGETGLGLPRPVLAQAERLLALALPAAGQPLTARGLQQAVARSGLFLEARQDQLREGAQAQAREPAPAAGTAPDLKAALLSLRAALATYVGQGEPLSQQPRPPTDAVAEARTVPRDAATPRREAAPADLLASTLPASTRPAPPSRDGTLQPLPPADPTLSPADTPAQAARTLLEQTESALDRLTLSQYASLPLEGARADPAQPQRWLTELPLALHVGTAVLPLQIEKEPPRREPGAAALGPLWRVRFALDVEPMGPLQGIVTLQGRAVAVTLWAEREETSRLLRRASPDLETALAAARFESGAIDIRTGRPKIAQATAGQFLDRLS